ncbi:MAG: MoxR family ATPase [Candidatus Limnocylindrales bacterium]
MAGHPSSVRVESADDRHRLRHRPRDSTCRHPVHRGADRGFPESRLHRGPIADHGRLPRPGTGSPPAARGEAGVGKTELAKVLAASLGAPLIRLQCYEGLDVNTAVYEWNYPRQMLEIRLLEARGEAEQATARDIFSREFLIRRPLLQALESTDGVAPVLLIDEIDRADEEFEAYLLEILSDFQVTVPEIGTIKADQPPRVILTSNRTREVHDALKRRCLYHWIDYPTAAKEYEIVLARVPDAPEQLAREVVGFVHRLREADLTKVPGIAETLDWAAALLSLGARELSPRGHRRDPRRRPQVRGGHPPDPWRADGPLCSPRSPPAAEPMAVEPE